MEQIKINDMINSLIKNYGYFLLKKLNTSFIEFNQLLLKLYSNLFLKLKI